MSLSPCALWEKSGVSGEMEGGEPLSRLYFQPLKLYKGASLHQDSLYGARRAMSVESLGMAESSQ